MSIKPVACADNGVLNWYADSKTAEKVDLYAIPDTHRVVSVEDLRLLLSFAPGEIPKSLDPTFYFTLTKDGDARIGGQLARIRAIIEDKP